MRDTKDKHSHLMSMRDHADMAVHLSELLVSLSLEIKGLDGDNDHQGELADRLHQRALNAKKFAAAYRRNVNARLGAL